MFVYLAGPVDAVSREEAVGWREQVTATLIEDPQIATFSPVGAISVGSQVVGQVATAEAIIQINETALSLADVVVANLDGPSFGTPIEIYQAKGVIVGFGGLSFMSNSIYQHRIDKWAPSHKEAAEIVLEMAQAERTP
jgi:hypothetical protein